MIWRNFNFTFIIRNRIFPFSVKRHTKSWRLRELSNKSCVLCKQNITTETIGNRTEKFDMTVLSRWRLSSGSFSSIRRYSSRKLKILFFGTDGFSIHSLQALHNESCNSEGAISRLESCCSEMKKLVPPVKKLSDQLSIACNPWPPDPDLCAKFDLGIVASFGHLIPSRIINAFPL